MSFGEYRNYGPGANYTYRVAYAKQLKDSEAAPYLDTSYIDGEEWLLSGESRPFIHAYRWRSTGLFHQTN